jgi:hypothetical protein
MKAGLEKACNGCIVRKPTASSPRSQTEAILIVEEYVKSPSPIAFSLPLIGAITAFCNDLRKLSCTSSNFYLRYCLTDSFSHISLAIHEANFYSGEHVECDGRHTGWWHQWKTWRNAVT